MDGLRAKLFFRLVASFIGIRIAGGDSPRVGIVVARITVIVPWSGVRVGAPVRGNVCFFVPIPV